MYSWVEVIKTKYACTCKSLLLLHAYEYEYLCNGYYISNFFWYFWNSVLIYYISTSKCFSGANAQS